MTAFRFPSHPPELPVEHMLDLPEEIRTWIQGMHQWAVEFHRQTEDAIEGLQARVRFTDQPALVPPATVSELTTTTPARFKAKTPRNGGASVVYCTDEAGGATLAFSDGSDWRRVSDRAVVS